jgi:hypothetical protein
MCLNIDELVLHTLFVAIDGWWFKVSEPVYISYGLTVSFFQSMSQQVS